MRVKKIIAELHKDIGSYKLIYSGRRSIGISISPVKGIVVRVPFLTSKKLINEIIERKAGWIKKIIKAYDAMPAAGSEKKYAEGEVHNFLGKEFCLKIFESQKNIVYIDDQNINLGLRDPYDHEKIKDVLYNWYKKEAGYLFGSILSEVIEKYKYCNFKPSGFTVRNMKRRWGSCSAKGKITLNTELIKLPVKYTEYVILHELCHLRHHNHGQEYYNLLNEIYPDWKRVRKEMKNYII